MTLRIRFVGQINRRAHGRRVTMRQRYFFIALTE